MITKLAINEWLRDEPMSTAEAMHYLLKSPGRDHYILDPDPNDEKLVQLRLGKFWVQTFLLPSALAVPVFTQTFYRIRERTQGIAPNITVEQVQELLNES